MVQLRIGENAIAPVTLRDYQAECLDRLVQYRMNGGARALVAMATGLGKTVCFAQIPARLPGRMLVIAHREELLNQAADKIQRANPALRVGVEQADRKAGGADVVVASIQTLAVTPRRLAGLGQFGTVVIDEVHHALATTYLRVLGHFGIAPDVSDLADGVLEKKQVSQEVRRRFAEFSPAHDAPYFVGFTATPTRSDGRGLEAVLDDIVFSRTLADGIDAGWLARVRGIRVDTGTDISGVKTHGSDFAERSLSDAVNTPERNLRAVAAYTQHAKGRQALVFAVDVQHAYDLAEAFQSSGIKAGAVVGATDTDERRRLIARYQRGDLQVLVNCFVLVEGFDAPETSALVMARPTKSSLVYTQMLGRGTRLAPGKTDLLVIDMADAGKAGVASVNTLFGLPPKLTLKATDDVLKVSRRVDEVAATVPQEAFEDATSLAGLEIASKEFDPLRAVGLEDWIIPHVRLSWVKTAFGYSLGIPPRKDDEGKVTDSGGSLGAVVDVLGGVQVSYKPRMGPPTTVGRFNNVMEALKHAEAWVVQRDPAIAAFSARDAKWREDVATEKQLALLSRLRVRHGAALTRGEASSLIDAALSKRR